MENTDFRNTPLGLLNKPIFTLSKLLNNTNIPVTSIAYNIEYLSKNTILLGVEDRYEEIINDAAPINSNARPEYGLLNIFRLVCLR